MLNQEQLVKNIVNDMSILSGDRMGDTSIIWQDVAGTLATNLQVLAQHVNDIRGGIIHSSFITVLIDQFEDAIKQS